MKMKLFLAAFLFLNLGMVGCARNDVNNDRIAYQNKNGTAPARIDNTNRPGGNNINVPAPGRNINNNTLNNDLRGANNINPDNRNIGNDLTRNNAGQPNGRSSMNIANQAAKKIADLREVDGAYVIVTDNNAYVAAKLPTGAKLTDNVKMKITKTVKAVDPKVNQVFISVNPDFYKHMQGYAGDINKGRPVSGIFNEFSNMIQRMFPDAKK